jgi:SAM-dependent methyltransferase
MKLRTILSLMTQGQLAVLLPLRRLIPAYHRLVFVASGLSSGILQRLARQPATAADLAAQMGIDATMRDGLEAWLELGVTVGELKVGAHGYRVRGKLTKRLVEPRNDAAAAFVEEVALLHNAVIMQTPGRLRRAQLFTLADQDPSMIARSSRLAEPLICEAMDSVIPPQGPLRLLEIGCGTGAYIRHAALRNSELTALGVDLQAEAAALAVRNVESWNLRSRVAIESGDIMQRHAEPGFDVATLHQNIYYFPVDRRVAVLRHVRGFLKPGGRLLLTTVCRGNTPGSAVLDLWGAMTAGCGRLPAAAEMVGQLAQAGFTAVTATKLAPGETFHAFVGTTP